MTSLLASLLTRLTEWCWPHRVWVCTDLDRDYDRQVLAVYRTEAGARAWLKRQLGKRRWEVAPATERQRQYCECDWIAFAVGDGGERVPPGLQAFSTEEAARDWVRVYGDEALTRARVTEVRLG